MIPDTKLLTTFWSPEADADSQSADHERDAVPGEPDDRQRGDEPADKDRVAGEGREREGDAGRHPHAREDLLVQGKAREARELPRDVKRETEGNDASDRQPDVPVADSGREHAAESSYEGTPQLGCRQEDVGPGEEAQPPQAASQTELEPTALGSHHVDEIESARLDHGLRQGLYGAHHGQPGRPEYGAPDGEEGDPIRQVRVAENRSDEADTEGDADQLQPAVENAEPEPAAQFLWNVANSLRATQPQDAGEGGCEIQQEKAPKDQIEARERQPDQLGQCERGNPERRSARGGGEQGAEDAQPERQSSDGEGQLKALRALGVQIEAQQETEEHRGGPRVSKRVRGWLCRAISWHVDLCRLLSQRSCSRERPAEHEHDEHLQGEPTEVELRIAQGLGPPSDRGW